MGISDRLQAMLTGGDLVTHQNAAIYLTKKEDAATPPLKNAPAPGQEEELPPKEPEPITDKPTKKPETPEQKVTPYSSSSFFTLWKDKQKDVILGLREKIPVGFDYIFNPINKNIIIYLKDAPGAIKQINPNTVLHYSPSGQIKITPELNRKENTVTKMTVQARYSMYGNNFNKRTIDIVAPDDDMSKLIEQIVNMAYTLTKSLNLI
jgi:hypothetical protein